MSDKTSISNSIEAILFYLAEPVKISFLAKTLEVSDEEITSSIQELKGSLSTRGLRLVENENEIFLVTAPEFSLLIEKMIKEERERDLGRAGIETLSIIAYKGPVSRKEIDYIRGVNSQYALRNLLLRGLVEKKSNANDERMLVYSITGDTLRFLGLSNVSELPEYIETNRKLEVTEEIEEKESDEHSE
ncbi:SMC-Scp complex subunit ScpB [Patescibacteria group bacterium]|nr:SMC-Scp complex subunit ScpB [Patescibacteria group bacterium]